MKNRLILATACALALAACEAPDRTDLGAINIQGTIAFTSHDESSLPLDNVAIDIIDIIRSRVGYRIGVNGRRIVAEGGLDNATLAAHTDATLGEHWQRSADFSAGMLTHPAIRVMAWETRRGPKRHYVMATWQETLTVANPEAARDNPEMTVGRRYRPIEIVYTRLEH